MDAGADNCLVKPFDARMSRFAGVLDDFANTITKLDGITGQPYPAYSASSPSFVSAPMVVHTDGTIFAVQSSSASGPSVIGIDPTSGTLKFSIPLNVQPVHNPIDSHLSCSSGPVFGNANVSSIIVAGDGNAYVGYSYPELDVDCTNGNSFISHLNLLQVSSSGTYSKIAIANLTAPLTDGEVSPEAQNAGIHMISNADTGVLLSWTVAWTGDSYSPPTPPLGMAITNGVSVTSINVPAGAGENSAVVPVLQRQDGSFVGTVNDSSGQTDMVAFDQSGNLLWSVPNDQPQIATDDNGIIGQSGTKYDQNGNVTAQTNPLVQSWRGNMYQLGSIEMIALDPALLATSLWALQGGNLSHSGATYKSIPTTLVIKKEKGEPEDCYSSVFDGGAGSVAERDITYAVVDQFRKRMQSVQIQEQILPGGSPCPAGDTYTNGVCIGAWISTEFEDSLSALASTQLMYTQMFWVQTLPHIAGYQAFFGQVRIDAYKPSPSAVTSLVLTPQAVSVNGNTGMYPNSTIPIRRCP